MSTSFIYHALGLSGYDYVRQDFVSGNVLIYVKPKAKLVRCSRCKHRHVIHKGRSERWLRTVPVGIKPIWIIVDVPRVQCRKCGCIRRIKLSIAAPRRWYTHKFERYVRSLVKMMTMLDVSTLLGVGWDVVKDIFKRDLKHRFGKPKLSELKYIAIDEISVRKGHKYLTLVMDLKSGAVVFVGDGKGAEALLPFWTRLKRNKAKIKAVATDLSPAYIGAVLENLPRVPLVFDHFHVVKLMNDKLTEVRRKLHREMKGTMYKDVLKGTRWLLLKNPENLNAERDEQQHLEEALLLNKPLATAYYLKEDLRQIWSQPNKEEAARFLASWISRARASGIAQLKTMANTLATHSFGILAWYDHPISSGPMEGTNNKIKTMKRQAYGYRDLEFFKLRIMGIHEAKYALTG